MLGTFKRGSECLEKFMRQYYDSITKIFLYVHFSQRVAKDCLRIVGVK